MNRYLPFSSRHRRRLLPHPRGRVGQRNGHANQQLSAPRLRTTVVVDVPDKVSPIVPSAIKPRSMVCIVLLLQNGPCLRTVGIDGTIIARIPRGLR